jgi:hypothetical protein
MKIETNHDYQSNHEDERYLTPSGRYFFKSKRHYDNRQSEYISYEQIKNFVVDIINDELPGECRQYIDIPIIKIEVKGTHEGSLVVFFTVLFNTLQVISGIKDVYDCIELIRELSEERVERRLREAYGDYFDVATIIRIPRDRYDERHFREMLCNGRYVPIFVSDPQPNGYYSQQKRDAFFYYLLVANIILFGIIVLLVIKALMKLYWA